MGRYRARDLLLVPALLSLARLPLAALFPVAVGSPWVALVVLLTAGLTDVLDGWWARRYSQTTATGAVIDGVSDKVFVAVVVVTLLLTGKLPLYGLLLLGARDLGELPLVLWMMLSRRMRRRRAEVSSANVPGKLATVMQFVAVTIALFELPYLQPALVATALVGIVATLSYWRRALGIGRHPATE